MLFKSNIFKNRYKYYEIKNKKIFLPLHEREFEHKKNNYRMNMIEMEENKVEITLIEYY